MSVGTADTNLTLEALYSEVELTMVAQEKVCPLSIEKAGEGTVIVATFAKVVDCSAGCQLDLPYGSQVTLTTKRSSNQWFVTDLGPDCGGQQYAQSGTCAFALTRPAKIRAKADEWILRSERLVLEIVGAARL